MSSSLSANWRKRKMDRNMDLVIRNAEMLLEQGMIHGGVGISNGKILLIARDEHLPDADNVIDARGKILMPGLIDAHAHFHDPMMLDHEDFTTGSRAAAAGGVTTFVDMPLTSNVILPKDIEEKISEGNNLSIVDFSLYAGMIDAENHVMIPRILEKGIEAFKAFSCSPYYADAGTLVRAMSEVSDCGGQLTIHSEDEGVLKAFLDDMEGEWNAPIAHALSRPNIAEHLAIQQNIAIARETGGHLHIAHVTTREGVEDIERAKAEALTITTEVCPHHLVFNRDDMNQLGPKSKMNPPLRSREDIASLWSGLLRGVIDMAVSDHAPCPMEKKTAGEDDIRQAWSGVDGTQMILRVLLSEGINKSRLSYDRLLAVACRSPAKIFGLYPRKGTIAIGADADLVIVDPMKEEKITSDLMFSKCGWTLYEGMTMKGGPLMTFVRGIQVFGEDRTMVPPGHGEFVPMGTPYRRRGE